MTKASAKHFSTNTVEQVSASAIELVCQVDSLLSLRTAVDAGADCIHLDYQDAWYANSPSSFKFESASLGKGLRYAHDKGCKVLLALNGLPPSGDWVRWRERTDQLAESGVDALVLNDPTTMLYAATHHSNVPLHFSMSTSPVSAAAINVLHRQFGIARVGLPGALSLAQVQQLSNHTRVELEVPGFAGYGMMPKGRHGDPKKTDRKLREASMSHAAIASGRQPSLYEALELCGDIESAANENCYAGSPGISALSVLPQLMSIGIRAIKVEARSGEHADVAQLTRIWREAIDVCREDLSSYAVKPSWLTELAKQH